jgi:hypothetical protein
MNLILRNQLPIRPLPGRGIQLVAGKENAASQSDAVTMGFAHYSIDYGPMAPHRHAEEIVFVLDSDRSTVRHGGFGDGPDALGEQIALERDMILHFPENEWHVFGYEEGGHLTIAFFYPSPGVYTGQVAKG